MRYAFLLRPHSNARYAASLEKLALSELSCFTDALRVPAVLSLETLGGGRFLTMDAPKLTEGQLSAISEHSSLCFWATREGEMLSPIPLSTEGYLQSDLPQVLKYKGKTNVEFTRMMINCARCASGRLISDKPLTVLDPVAGRGTTLLCALERGMNSVGIELDERAAVETEQYVERYLKYHRLKHRKERSSRTLAGGRSAKGVCFTLSNDQDSYKRGDTRSLTVFRADTRDAEAIVGKSGCDLIVGDLPYGVQHAPKAGGKLSEPETLLSRSLPGYLTSLRTGGAIALSFNVNTLKRETVIELLDRAGFTVKREAPYNDFEHWVEQAVTRDFVVAVR